MVLLLKGNCELRHGVKVEALDLRHLRHLCGVTGVTFLLPSRLQRHPNRQTLVEAGLLDLFCPWGILTPTRSACRSLVSQLLVDVTDVSLFVLLSSAVLAELCGATETSEGNRLRMTSKILS